MSVDPMTYEAQFFGFTPQTCMLRIYIAFQDYLFEVMQAVEQVILKKLDGIPDCDISPVQIRKCTEKFLCFMKGHFDNLFSKMEQLFLQLILRIPSKTSCFLKINVRRYLIVRKIFSISRKILNSYRRSTRLNYVLSRPLLQN